MKSCKFLRFFQNAVLEIFEEVLEDKKKNLKVIKKQANYDLYLTELKRN